jgi:antitoxin component of MazEF toxin-antitoxin module
MKEIWNNQNNQDFQQDDEEISIKSAFGLWKNRNITKEKNKLSELLDNINEKNIHSEIETNKSVGNEIW